MHAEAELVSTGGSAQGGTVIVTLQDLTRLHRAEEAVRQLSYFDTATGLPNRRHLAEQIPTVRREQASVVAAVVAIRLHGFDRIVQAQGLEFANKLVARMARVVERELASVCEGGAIPWHASNAVCRTATANSRCCSPRPRFERPPRAGIARVILESVSTHGSATDSDYTPALSAGIAFVEGSNVDPDLLLQNAHAAAEQAREPRSCEVYSPVPQARSPPAVDRVGAARCGRASRDVDRLPAARYRRHL